MFNPVLGRLSLAVGALLSVAALPVTAASSVEESLALSMSKGIRDRMFWNLQVVSAKTKTKSEEPRDITGPVLLIKDVGSPGDYGDLATLSSKDNLLGYLSRQIDQIYANAPDPLNLSASDQAAVDGLDVKLQLYANQVVDPLTSGLLVDYANGNSNIADGLGTPKGIKAKAGDPSPTVALSVGYHLDDSNKWAVEALLLGAPLNVSVYGAGQRSGSSGDFGITGREVIKTKMLPPLVKFGYTIGDRDWIVRPYVGIAAMYAIFFDTKSTKDFSVYQGGATSVSIKNSFGVGPMLGLSSGDLSESGWRVGVSVGKIRLKTEATLVTRGTMISSDSAVTNDYGPLVNAAIDAGEGAVNSTNRQYFPNGFTTELIKDLAAFKATKGGDGTLGTFVRKQKSTLDNTIFMLSVGRSF